jgi:MOSC domain-containing protein YiiM
VLALPRGTRLHLGEQAVVRVTGLRNPCQQINDFRAGLLKVAIIRDANGELVRKAGIMSVVERGGTVVPSDAIRVELPPGPPIPLDRV